MTFSLQCERGQELILDFSARDKQGNLWCIELPLMQKLELAFNTDTAELKVNNQLSDSMVKRHSSSPNLDKLRFAQPIFSLTHLAETRMNYLRNKIEGNSVEIALD